MRSFREAIADSAEMLFVREPTPHVIEIESDRAGLAIRPSDRFVDSDRFETCVINRQ